MINRVKQIALFTKLNKTSEAKVKLVVNKRDLVMKNRTFFH